MRPLPPAESFPKVIAGVSTWALYWKRSFRQAGRSRSRQTGQARSPIFKQQRRPASGPRDFYAAVAGDRRGIRLIAEIKKSYSSAA